MPFYNNCLVLFCAFECLLYFYNKIFTSIHETRLFSLYYCLCTTYTMRMKIVIQEEEVQGRGRNRQELELVLQNTQKLKGTNIYINENFCEATLAKKRALLYQLKQAREIRVKLPSSPSLGWLFVTVILLLFSPLRPIISLLLVTCPILKNLISLPSNLQIPYSSSLLNQSVRLYVSPKFQQ